MVGTLRTPSKPLQVDTSSNGDVTTASYSHTDVDTPNTEASTPGATRYNTNAKSSTNTNSNNDAYAHAHDAATTPKGFRGHSDLRSPGISKTPTANTNMNTNTNAQGPLPNFMTQTDKYGNAITPTNTAAADIHENGTDETDGEGDDDGDAYDTLLESLRMMCCCILPEPAQVQHHLQKEVQPPQKSLPVHEFPIKQIMKADVDVPHDIKLLPSIHPDDSCHGKKCLVLDLDETLVHSSFRAVPDADIVIPVQIEDIVHYVYVMKRPGVDEFLIEMAKHYEIVIYTASLNKYADPLLDLLDPQKTIHHRLFRESCVYCEGSYVKDLNLINRDLGQSIIIDNSPASYLFHPDNAIDCSSFIDDPADRELYQIGSFLKGVKNVHDVRGVMNMWKQWPRIPTIPLVEYPEQYDEDDRQVSEPLQV